MKEISYSEFLNLQDALLIDVRSPFEYQKSHIPCAINYAVLNDDQRHEVGAIYKHDRLEGKIKGAAYICENISKFLKDNLDILKNKKNIVFYCARGGLRSESFFIIFKYIGLNVYKLKGGYKAYRQYVLEFFEKFEYKNFVVIDGLTGSGKTEIIKYFENSIDLEGLARHRGSVFGKVGEISGAMFENLLFEELRKKTIFNHIFVEAEGRKIGNIFLPKKVHENIEKGIRIWLSVPFEMRVERIVKNYSIISKEEFFEAIFKIKKYMKREDFDEVMKAYEIGDFYKTAEILLKNYYDKIYKKRDVDFEVICKSPNDCVEKIKKLLKSNKL
ncbi:tRNA 2-selenouridine(34) synthase MnmH [Caminibacter sp.]